MVVVQSPRLLLDRQSNILNHRPLLRLYTRYRHSPHRSGQHKLPRTRYHPRSHLRAQQEQGDTGPSVRCKRPAALALKMRSLEPFLFQGGDPESDAYMWFSFLDTPSNNSRHEDPDTYES